MGLLARGWMPARGALIVCLLSLAGCADDGSFNFPGSSTENSPTDPATAAPAGEGLPATDTTPTNEDSPSEPPPRYVGGWVATFEGCEQRIILGAAGRFTLTTRVISGEESRLATVDGTVEAEASDTDSGWKMRFDPDSPPVPDGLTTCEQWVRRADVDLDAGGAASNAGIQLGTLQLRTEVSPLLGKMTVGTDEDRSDRFVLFQSAAGRLKTVTFAGAPDTPEAPYHSLIGDAGAGFLSTSGVEVFLVPGEVVSKSFPAAPPNMPLASLLLNVTSAVELTVANSRESPDLPPCNFSYYADLLFSSRIFHHAFEGEPSEVTFRLDPNEDGGYLVPRPVTGTTGDGASAGVGGVAYLLPLIIESPEAGPCALSARARPLVVSLVESIAAADDAAVLPALGPRPLVTETGAGAHLQLSAVPPSVARGGARLGERALSLLPLDAGGASPDFLNLLDLREDPVTIVLGERDGALQLTVYPGGDSGGGVGPFARYIPLDGAALLAIPGTAEGIFEGDETPHPFRIELAEAGRVEISGSGAPRLEGVLRDEDGREWARNRDGVAADGATDGGSFRMVRTLPAGIYHLLVRNLDGAGAYGVTASDGSAFPILDDALAACLIEAGWHESAAPEHTELDCTGRGIASLAGLEALPALQRLALGGNTIADLTPLADMVDLRELALDDNGVTDPAPLQNALLLTRLSLAGNPIDSSALPMVQHWAVALTHLDLAGVTTLPTDAMEALRSQSHNALLILPDASVEEARE